MKPVEPILTIELFPPLSAALLTVLKQIQSAAWDNLTVCAPWTVKDVAAHLLGGSIGRLAAACHTLAPLNSPGADYEALFALREQLLQNAKAVTGYADLVDLINTLNAGWVEATRHYRPAQLIEFLEITDELLYRHFKTWPPYEAAPIAVAWAGETQSPNWFDIAREYTEKWLHQQHIREAVGQPILDSRRWLLPVLDTFMRALPVTYQNVAAPEQTAITIHLTGPAGGEWSLLRQDHRWVLFAGVAPQAAASIWLEQDVAWRLFTKGISPSNAQKQIQIDGNAALGAEMLKTVSIMA
jgi:hypothetical protein